jgi:SAM-dependent methyltransferase
MDSISPRFYDPTRYAELFAAEDRHFWFRARNRAILALVASITADFPAGYRALEVGCGTGNTLRTLVQACPGGLVVGMDLFSEGLHHARMRTAFPLVQADMQAAPFRARFQLIGLFDVLEHLPDDERALADLHGLLRPGGALVMTVPAHPSLWSYHDDAAGHRRRYRSDALRAKLGAAGYEVEYLSEYMMSMLPLIWLRRLPTLLRRRALSPECVRSLRARELDTPGLVNALLSAVLGQEARAIARRWHLPVGSSIIAVARRGC